jgi:hypothetical protein
MNTKVWAILGGATGAALVHYAFQQRIMAFHEIKIRIKQSDDGRCTSETDDARASKLDLLAWRIVGNTNCLGGGRVELRFAEDTNPLLERRPSGKRKILDLVINGIPRVYKYEVWFVGEEEEYLMEDPKLEIVEI